MSEIFISHAVADTKLADKFVGFLKEAIGVPAQSIFCSSVDGHNIPLGSDFNDYIKDQIQSPKLVILIMTPRYMESHFCLMELGATWAKSHRALPIVVAPVKFDVISKTLGLKQGWNIDDEAKLIDLREMVKSLSITLEHRTEHDWAKKRAVWKADLKKLMKSLAPATNVPASEHETIKSELNSAKNELAGLQEAYAEATDLIDELKAAKDPVAVKEIMASKGGLDAEAIFYDLLGEISELRPKVGIYFYRNIIMDFYNKAAPVDWYDSDQKTDGQTAIQYNVMEGDAPHGFLWGGKRLKKVSAAIKALENFLESEEAQLFVKERERDGHTMDTTDLEFWEENLS